MYEGVVRRPRRRRRAVLAVAGNAGAVGPARVRRTVDVGAVAGGDRDAPPGWPRNIS